jgi:hypothetical protein
MFSLDNFYYTLYKNLVEPLDLDCHYFYPYGSTAITDLVRLNRIYRHGFLNRENFVLFYDQEPLFTKNLDQLISNTTLTVYKYQPMTMNPTTNILANSEHSIEKDKICQEHGFADWYYFSHGFLCLDWYRDYQYIPNIENQPSKLFITFNNLVTKERSYRLNLVTELVKSGLADQGHVSCRLSDVNGTWKDELISTNSLLTKESKIQIYHAFKNFNTDLTIDTGHAGGDSSAKFNIELQQSGLWHLVTETVFYHNKLHLTEKIFKPIVAQRPFILVGAPGNLAYLKSYGFETFDQWIDESYDNETDNDLRIQKVVNQLSKFSGFTQSDILDLQNEMRPVTEHNFNHFYTDFKEKIVTEMLFNFEKCLDQQRISYKQIDFKAIKKRFLQ